MRTTAAAHHHELTRPAGNIHQGFEDSFFGIAGRLTIHEARSLMPCDVEILKEVPFFSLLDDDELKVLAAQVEMRTFMPRQRIYRIGDASARAYVLVSGAVDVTTIDEDHQDVIFDQPARGQFFGFASLLDQTPHQTNATAIEPTICIEIDRHDIATLVQQRPHAALDMFAILGQQMHAAQHLIRGRAARNPNEMIEAEATIGDRVADAVAAFGGSWTFIISFAVTLVVYTA